MPSVERKRVTMYAYPWVADALEGLTHKWGCSLNDVLNIMVKWGVYGLRLEAYRQGKSEEVVALSELEGALDVGMQIWGPVTPERPLSERTLRDGLTLLMRDLAEFKPADAPEPGHE